MTLIAMIVVNHEEWRIKYEWHQDTTDACTQKKPRDKMLHNKTPTRQNVTLCLVRLDMLKIVEIEGLAILKCRVQDWKNYRFIAIVKIWEQLKYKWINIHIKGCVFHLLQSTRWKIQQNWEWQQTMRWSNKTLLWNVGRASPLGIRQVSWTRNVFDVEC